MFLYGFKLTIIYLNTQLNSIYAYILFLLIYFTTTNQKLENRSI